MACSPCTTTSSPVPATRCSTTARRAAPASTTVPGRPPGAAARTARWPRAPCCRWSPALHRSIGAYAGVDALVSPSRFLAGVVRDAGSGPRPAARRPPLPAARRRTAGRRPQADGGAPDGPGPLVFAGRLSPEKGVDVAGARRWPACRRARLEVAGEGPSATRLERLADEVAPGRVRFHGRLGREEVARLVAGAVATVAPARWYENQPMTVLESYAAGVPVVTTDLGGLPELVDDGVDGFLVPPTTRPPSPPRSAASSPTPRSLPGWARSDAPASARSTPPPAHLALPSTSSTRGRPWLSPTRSDRRTDEARCACCTSPARAAAAAPWCPPCSASCEGVAAVGELRYLWARGVQDDQLCGCGEPFSRCAAVARGGRRASSSAPVGRSTPRRSPGGCTAAPGCGGCPGSSAAGSAGSRRTPVTPTTRSWSGSTARSAPAPGPGWSSTPRSCPPTGCCCEGLPGVEVTVLHLVRDPRAAACSWLRAARHPPARRRPADGPPAPREERGALDAVERSSAALAAWPPVRGALAPAAAVRGRRARPRRRPGPRAAGPRCRPGRPAVRRPRHGAAGHHPRGGGQPLPPRRSATSPCTTTPSGAAGCGRAHRLVVSAITAPARLLVRGPRSRRRPSRGGRPGTVVAP